MGGGAGRRGKGTHTCVSYVALIQGLLLISIAPQSSGGNMFHCLHSHAPGRGSLDTLGPIFQQ